MAGLSGALAPVTRFQVANVPIGKGAALAVGMGVGDAIRGIVKGFVSRTPVVQGRWAEQTIDLGVAFGTAWAVANVRPIKNTLGPELSQLMAIGIVADAINDSFRIQENTANMIGGWFGGRIVSKSPPSFVRRAPVSVPGGSMSGRSDLYASALGG